MSKFKKTELVIYPIFIVVMIVLDQITKIIAQSVLPFGGTGVKVIDRFFYFTYMTNYGGAWSLFEGHTWIFVIAAVVAVGALGYFFFKTKPEDKFARFGFALVIAGAIGNCLDRIMLGFVRDFVDLIIFGYDFPIFNIADICIVLGVFLIILDTFEEELKQWRQSRKS
ncbi:MAG: signal peptidase II [Beduini sp.]|uniref:signal peptidase II n=1 Tax=Beduini sp. TaxID=1922300 RepID=UPI0011CB02A4